MTTRDTQVDLDEFKSEGDLNLSEQRLEWQKRNSNPETDSWLTRDSDVFLHQSLSTPCLDVIEATSQNGIKNLQGKTYLDFHGNSVHQVGFGHPKVLDAIRSQLDSLPFCPRRFTNRSAIRLAERLVELSVDGLDKVLFAPGGTSAVGIALKIARAVTGRFKTISMWDSFHGASLDAISLGGEAVFRKDAGPLLPGAEHVPPPNPSDCPFGCNGTCNLKCADYVDYVLDKEGDVAAVISETVSSVPYFPPKEYWKRIRAACDRHNAVLIMDEIPHSLGRTGKLFTHEHYDITPDILVLGKGLGGGVMPLAAVLCRKDHDVSADRALGHYTHEKNPVACAAGLATLEVLVEENLPERARLLGRDTLDRLNHELHNQPIVSEVRGLGLLLGVELDRSIENISTVAEKIMYACLDAGLSFKISMGNVLTLAPPLNIEETELEHAVDILVGAIKAVQTETSIH